MATYIYMNKFQVMFFPWRHQAITWTSVNSSSVRSWYEFEPFTFENYNHTYPGPLRPRHNGRHFADDIFKCNFLNEYIYKFRLTFDWSFFLGFKLTIFKHWFRKWLGAGHATSLYLSQWWSRLLTHICVTWPQWVKYQYFCKYCDK